MGEGWTDGWWTSADGCRLHYRDYPGRSDRPVVVCLPGLTRNARDFDAVARRISGEWRVLAVSLRGRGESAYAKEAASYAPPAYRDDVLALLDSFAAPRMVAIGTSLGGIVTMLIAAAAPERLAGALLNDVGPELDPAGLSRIRGYVGRSAAFPTWLHAARAVAENARAAHPAFRLPDWIAMAKRLCRVTSAGRIVWDYDPRISEPFRQPEGAAPPDMWPLYEGLAGRPVTIVRGALSDLLSAGTFARMGERLAVDAFTVPNVGHAPTLSEPEAEAAIDRLLARVAAS
jgi:pimeloyl-ACP methyl ester carboxylesterase